MLTFFKVLVSALFMGLAAYGFALVPLKVAIPVQKLGLVSSLGMGILVGTVLCLVIPEGVETLYEAVEGLEYDPLFCIGMSLLAGFALMFVLDNCSLRFELSSDSNNLEWRRKLVSVATSTLTVGLLLHSFVDGIALGTSFLNGDTSFELLFFFVIIIHKLPTAMSLSVVLLQEGLPAEMCQFHALLFSLSTPLASILTYTIAICFDVKSLFAVGCLLLISAGTFLYSVMHVMNEITHKADYSPMEEQRPESMSRLQLLLAALGMVVPVAFAQLG